MSHGVRAEVYPGAQLHHEKGMCNGGPEDSQKHSSSSYMLFKFFSMTEPPPGVGSSKCPWGSCATLKCGLGTVYVRFVMAFLYIAYNCPEGQCERKVCSSSPRPALLHVTVLLRCSLKLWFWTHKPTVSTW